MNTISSDEEKGNCNWSMDIDEKNLKQDYSQIQNKKGISSKNKIDFKHPRSDGKKFYSARVTETDDDENTAINDLKSYRIVKFHVPRNNNKSINYKV